ncbi:hypothetical protein D3C84_1025690 [compost metagenome]
MNAILDKVFFFPFASFIPIYNHRLRKLCGHLGQCGVDMILPVAGHARVHNNNLLHISQRSQGTTQLIWIERPIGAKFNNNSFAQQILGPQFIYNPWQLGHLPADFSIYNDAWQ